MTSLTTQPLQKYPDVCMHFGLTGDMIDRVEADSKTTDLQHLLLLDALSGCLDALPVILLEDSVVVSVQRGALIASRVLVQQARSAVNGLIQEKFHNRRVSIVGIL